MALYPCLVNSHRYAGPQSSAYLTIVASDRPESRKARLCPDHLSKMAEIFGSMLQPVAESLQSSMVCQHCDDPSTQIVFATAYGPGGSERAWAGDLCGSHAAVCLAAVGWGDWTPRRA